MFKFLPSILLSADHLVLGLLFSVSIIIIILVMTSNCVQLQIDKVLDQKIWLKKVGRSKDYI